MCCSTLYILHVLFFLILRRPPRSTLSSSSAASDVYKRQEVSTVDPRDALCVKRSEYMSWDKYFMSVALLSAQRSKDPKTQVGAAIVNEDKIVVGIGYNGFPIGCSDDVLPWARSADDELDTKYPYVYHAEMNAILSLIHISEPTRLLSISYAVFCLKKKKKKNQKT
eukprot:TRINITY_DN49673_c0_g1_i1.p1 TRINITY_DN49673_c0_g1~~TRINITY_DN49673_c0_g1_i1.p1  ORF type:complete len:167 (-),score=55.94 TRINITY_DN49673_c0_g1_i1:69-569(-)